MAIPWRIYGIWTRQPALVEDSVHSHNSGHQETNCLSLLSIQQPRHPYYTTLSTTIEKKGTKIEFKLQIFIIKCWVSGKIIFQKRRHRCSLRINIAHLKVQNLITWSYWILFEMVNVRLAVKSQWDRVYVLGTILEYVSTSSPFNRTSSFEASNLAGGPKSLTACIWRQKQYLLFNK